MKAVIMAGGEGSRLRPITNGRPKPLAPVCNRPIMEHLIGLLKRHGITEVLATLHYLAPDIQSYFGDGSEWGIELEYQTEDSPLGTAGSVKAAEKRLKSGAFLIASGDALTDIDLTKAIAFHREKRALATLILSRVVKPLEFGVVVTDSEGRIERFVEKPTWSQVVSDTVNTGMYILEPEILERMEPGRRYDWSQDIFPALLREGAALYGFVADGYWADLGALPQYREANVDLLSRKVQLEIAGVEIQAGVFVDGESNIDPNAVLIPPICIGRNVKIKAGARIGPYCSIGDHSLIEENASIERSVLWESVYVGHGARVSSAIVGSRVTIKKDAQIQEESVIGDRCLIDVGATIRPKVKIWPDKIIERGSTVTMSLIWGSKWSATFFRDLGVAGLSNLEITPEFATRLGAAFGSCLPAGSTIVTSRDNTRSSRMIKRAMIASFLGVGCDVVDMRAVAAPIVRHYLRSSGAAGGVHVRKLPGNSRVTLVEFFGADGSYVSPNFERKVESAFSREDFARTDPDDLGSLSYADRAIEGYKCDFLNRLLPNKPIDKKAPIRVICDLGHSPISGVLSAAMTEMGIEASYLHENVDAKLAPRTPEELKRHLAELGAVVKQSGSAIGALFSEEGERMHLVDGDGNRIDGSKILGLMGAAMSERGGTIVIPASTSTSLTAWLENLGFAIERSKVNPKSLLQDGLELKATFCGDSNGGFNFPDFHAGFDAIFAFAMLVRWVQASGRTLDEHLAKLPEAFVSRGLAKAASDAKGLVMRKLAETAGDGCEVDTLDGVRIVRGDEWVLAIPDSIEPEIHLFAESESPRRSEQLVDEYCEKIESWAAEAI